MRPATLFAARHKRGHCRAATTGAAGAVRAAGPRRQRALMALMQRHERTRRRRRQVDEGATRLYFASSVGKINT